MNPNFRNFALWAIIALLLIALFNMFQSPSERTAGRDIAYSQFLQDVDAGRVRDVTIVGERISPILLILGVWIFFMRQMQGGSRGKPWALASRRPSF
jgi:cell division protease FtsH